MSKKKISDKIQLLDVVALTEDIPDRHLWRGEIGTVVECYPDDAYEVEFVAQDGNTYALVTLPGDQLVPLRQKRAYSDAAPQPASFQL